MSMMLVRQRHLRLDGLAARCGVHPELVRRLVVLGLLEPVSGVAQAGRRDDEVWFRVDQIERLQRLLRLRRDLALNYAALGLVLDLLDRIEQLEAERRRAVAPEGGDD